MIRPLLLALALLAIAPLQASAAQSEAPAPVASAAVPEPVRNTDGSFTVKLPLTSLSPVRNVTLRGVSAAFSFTLPVPERWEVKRAALTFGYVNSSSLLPRLSRLTFAVSGKTLAQIELRPESPKGRVEIPIPGSLLPVGYNECTFLAVQSYTEEFCEYPQHQSLWTTLELDQASVEVTYALKPVPQRLSAVADFLFDPRSFLGAEVHVAVPEISEQTVKQAALAASGVALRLDYQAARLTVSDRLRPGCDNIVIGDATFAQRLLGPTAPRPGESAMAILPGPPRPGTNVPDPDTAVILLTGNPEGVQKAVRAFSYLSFPFPDTPTVDISKVSDPAPAMLEAARNVSPDKEYSLRALGFATRTFRTDQARATPVDIPFTLSSGLDLNPNSYVALSLHMAYAPGMREDSVLTIHINGIYVGGVHLADVKGGTFLDYRVNLPVFAMHKGSNTLTLTPVLNPLKTNLCEFYQSENLLLTLFDDSTLTFPDLPLFVRLPDLALLYQDAFPYARWADLRGSTLLLGDKSPETVRAAVNLAAQAAQRTGLPPLGLDVSFGPEAKGNVLAVGPVDALPKPLVSAAPFSLLPQGPRPYPQMPRPKARADDAASHKAPLWAKYLPFLWESGRKHMEVTSSLWADVRNGASLTPGKGVVTQFKAPGSTEDTVTLFTGATPADVAALAARLWEPAVRSKLDGDMAMVDLASPQPRAVTLDVGESYYIGRIGVSPKLTILVNTYPWISLGVVAGLLALFAYASWRVLKVFRARRG
ncbi:Cyclic di-GMP-binding protein [Fundidesulfovibrio magnetotacticus]|uniref:Cyclic di-GMP-binding protein n=1 Tax=Fundidesulfovibrio magnetotacticus TaxID=2730080 RepID=A0A6V8LVJ7_9BACT|nr:cellulose biosynthesis cyclic di-GMP-binding regulatory protein BcsB [Fundidesulfovibrio magnetotacticus]GFK94119.1 Cyclic di-GMP-binding protein [Fundidesulfovibrio magnetotacticus]